MNDPTDQNYPVLTYHQVKKRDHDGVFRFEADEFHSEWSASFSVSTKASIDAFTIPAGKKLHIRTVEYRQRRHAVPTIIDLKDGDGTTQWSFGLASGATSYGRTGIIGVTATGKLSIVCLSKITARITVGGILDCQDRGY
jgi:hypothetical protein